MQTLITWPYRLTQGHSPDPAKGACALDAINWLAHGRHGDTPLCVCHLIRSYVMTGNDLMPDDARQRLLPYLPRIAGSRSDSHFPKRDHLLRIEVARTFGAGLLEEHGYGKEATRLRALPDSVDLIHATSLTEELGLHETSETIMAPSLLLGRRAADRASTLAFLTRSWDAYFEVLDKLLNAGSQGEPWSADVLDLGVRRYAEAGGMMTEPVA